MEKDAAGSRFVPEYGGQTDATGEIGLQKGPALVRSRKEYYGKKNWNPYMPQVPGSSNGNISWMRVPGRFGWTST